MGVINKSFIIITSMSKYVLRLYARTNKEEIEFELCLLNLLKQLPVPNLISIDGRELLNFGKSLGIIYPYIPGKHLKKFSTIQRMEIGKFLAQMHIEGKKFKKNIRRKGIYTFSPLRIKEMCATIKQNNSDYLERMPILKNGILRYELSGSLLKGPIHVDVKPENVLFYKGVLSGVLDFDNAYVGPYILDLAKSMIWFGLKGNRFDLNMAFDVYSGYLSIRKLSINECKELYNAIKYAFVSHLFIDLYMWSIKKIPRNYFNFLMNDFYDAYENFEYTPKEFYIFLKQKTINYYE